MICNGPDIGSPFFWIFLSALFFGGALSCATILPSRRRNPRRSRRYKWIFFCLDLSISIILAMAAVFIPGAEKILDHRLLYFFPAVMLLSFLALRFKLIFGLPLLAGLTTAVFILIYFLQGWTCVPESSEIASFKAFSANQGILKIDFRTKEAETGFIEIQGDSFAPVLDLLTFPDYLFLFKTKTFYRFNGFSVYGDGKFIDSIPSPLPDKGSGDGRFRFFRSVSDSVRGMEVASGITTEPLKPVLYREYNIVIRSRSAIDIESFMF